LELSDRVFCLLIGCCIYLFKFLWFCLFLLFMYIWSLLYADFFMFDVAVLPNMSQSTLVQFLCWFQVKDVYLSWFFIQQRRWLPHQNQKSYSKLFFSLWFLFLGFLTCRFLSYDICKY
jgi:hypothetical protein